MGVLVMSIALAEPRTGPHVVDARHRPLAYRPSLRAAWAFSSSSSSSSSRGRRGLRSSNSRAHAPDLLTSTAQSPPGGAGCYSLSGLVWRASQIDMVRSCDTSVAATKWVERRVRRARVQNAGWRVQVTSEIDSLQVGI